MPDDFDGVDIPDRPNAWHADLPELDQDGKQMLLDLILAALEHHPTLTRTNVRTLAQIVAARRTGLVNGEPE